MLLCGRKYCDLVNLLKLMDGSLLKCSVYSQDRQNLFTRITFTNFKIVFRDSKGCKDFKYLSD